LHNRTVVRGSIQRFAGEFLVAEEPRLDFASAVLEVGECNGLVASVMPVVDVESATYRISGEKKSAPTRFTVTACVRKNGVNCRAE